MELSPRLQTIAEWVPQGASFADVGTDHGYLPVWLLRSGRIQKAIAADLRSGPLNSARKTALRFQVKDAVDFRLCDGLAGIGPDEADTIAIAGMGGETIAGILEAAPWTADRDTLLLLQPQTAFYELRTFLSSHGYQILEEKIIREGHRLYIAIKARAGKEQTMNRGELWAGRNSNDPLRGEYLIWIAGVLQKTLDGKRRGSNSDETELAELQTALNEIQRMKEEWESWQ